jgi:hypothetical protein
MPSFDELLDPVPEGCAPEHWAARSENLKRALRAVDDVAMAVEIEPLAVVQIAGLLPEPSGQ